MPRARFSLRIEVPEEIDPDVYDEILNASEPDDSEDARLLRWLGDTLSDVEDDLSSRLPEGFYAKIEQGKVLP